MLTSDFECFFCFHVCYLCYLLWTSRYSQAHREWALMLIHQEPTKIGHEVFNALERARDNLEFAIFFHLAFSILPLLFLLLPSLRSCFNCHFSSEGGVGYWSLMWKLIFGVKMIIMLCKVSNILYIHIIVQLLNIEIYLLACLRSVES